MRKANIYSDISGYSVSPLTEDKLSKYRKGLSAANPAEAIQLVKEIDRLRKDLNEKPKIVYQEYLVKRTSYTGYVLSAFLLACMIYMSHSYQLLFWE